MVFNDELPILTLYFKAEWSKFLSYFRPKRMARKPYPFAATHTCTAYVRGKGLLPSPPTPLVF